MLENWENAEVAISLDENFMVLMYTRGQILQEYLILRKNVT